MGRVRPKRASQVAAVERAWADLRSIAQDRAKTDFEMKNDIFSIISTYKEACQALSERRSACLQKLKTACPKAYSTLERDPYCRVPFPDRVIFDINGIIVSYMPDEDDDFRFPKAVSSEGSSGSYDPAKMNRIETPTPNSHSTSPMTKVCQSLPSRTASDCSTRSDKHEESEPASTISNPSLAPSEFATASDGPARPVDTSSSATEPPEERMTTLTKAKSGNYWIFPYPREPDSPLYTMRCPSRSCSNPTFSRHPLCRQRAMKHFEFCKVPFRDEKDMVLRYASLVVGDRRKGPMRKRAREHNATLLGKHEQRLQRENL